MLKFRSFGTWIALFAFVQTSALSLASEKDFAQYWKDSGLTFQKTEFYYSDKACYAEARFFLGCVRAVNTLLAAQKMALVTPEQAADFEAQGATVEVVNTGLTNDGVKVVKLSRATQPPKVTRATPKTAIERAKQNRAQWLAVFKVAPAVQVPFSTVLAFIKTTVLNPATEPELAANALNAYLSTAEDPHTSIMPRDFMNDQREPKAEEFFGIGAMVGYFNGQLTVQVIDGSPAETAGLRTGDVLLAINDEPVANMSVDDVTKRCRGAQGTVVRLTVKRINPTVISITRGPIVVSNVTKRLLSDGKTGYIKINNFLDEGTAYDVAAAAIKLEKQGAKGLVLDLRDNPGGGIEVVAQVAGVFLPPFTLVVETRPIASTLPATSRPKAGGYGPSLPGGYDDEFSGGYGGGGFGGAFGDSRYMTQEGPDTRLPMVTIINSQSASASEILAGVLQDQQRSLIVGERSFGKGSVQELEPSFLGPKILLARTTSRYYLATGRTPQLVGITPDLEVYRRPSPTEEDKFGFREEDLYVNALPPESKTWTQPRPEYVETIHNCIDQTNVSEQTFNDEAAQGITADFQLLYARDALRCVLETSNKWR